MSRPPSPPRGAGARALAVALLGFSSTFAQSPAERITPQPVGVPRAPSARGPLPDPALLDGAGQPAEKKSEFGLLGQFERPGEEPATDGKGNVAQRPGQPAGAAQGSGPSDAPASANGGRSGPPGLPPAGQPGGGSGQGDPAGVAQAKGGHAGASGAQQAGGAGKAGTIISGGDPSAQAQGIQVGELTGAPNGQAGNGPAGNGQKPGAVALGDKAMRIEPAATPPGVIGSANQKVSESTQQYEKGTGSGGKGAAGTGGGNRVEKGRVVPAGL